MRIYLGADHAGYPLKEKIKKWLVEWGYEFEDKGAFALDPTDDYPTFIAPVAQAVSENPDGVRGIVLGGSGQGEAMAANRFHGVRAAVYYGGPRDFVRLSREHNNANILSLAGRFLSDKEARGAIKLWLETPFSGEERHVRRLKQIDELEI